MRIARIAFLLISACMSMSGAAQVVPDYYEEPGLNPMREQVAQNAVEYVDPFSGTLILRYVDMTVPGNGGMDIKVQRTYTTVQYDRLYTSWQRSPTGLGWSIHFGRVLNSNAFVCSNTNINLTDNPVLELPDGSRQIFYTPTGAADPNNIWITASRWKAKCDTTFPTLGLVVTSPDGVQYTMNKREDRYALNNTYSWYTTQIKDRNNNTLTISYIDDPQGYKLINQVSGGADGRVVTFAYTGAGTPGVRLNTITLAGSPNQVWTYGYTLVSGISGDFYQLTSVLRPDGLSWAYLYNGLISGNAGSYEMQRVTYPRGGTTTYSYGFTLWDGCAGFADNTVVTQKVTGGTSITAGTTTFAYSPDWNNGATVGDVTTVVSPAGRYVYTHHGFTTAVPGTMWKIGLLLKKQSSTLASVLLETEDLTWGSQVISDDDYARPTRSACLNHTDSQTLAPQLTQRKVTRDGTAHTTDYSNFDVYGNPQTVVETGNASRTTTLTYYTNTTAWVVKQLKDETISGFGSITRTVDSVGNLTGETRYGVATTFVRYPSGEVQKATNARTFFTTYGTYKRGIPESETQPEGRILNRTVDDAGNITSERDGEGRTTSFTYDTLNRLTGITYPINAAATITWGADTYCAGLKSKRLVRADFVETTCFDGYNRPVKVQQKNSAGTVAVARTFTYDAAGRKSFESYPGSATGTTYTYDALNRLLTVSHPGGTKKTLVYQSANRVQVTNERSKVTTFTYRSYGNPDERALMLIDTSVANADVTLTRDPISQILTIAQGGKTTTYGYNTNKFLTTVTQPEIAVTTYGRDAVGNMSSRQVGASGTTSYTYDGLNRLTLTNHPGTTPDVQRTYDKNNRLTRLKTVDSGSVVLTDRTYVYDWNGNLQTETLALDGRTYSVGYTYNTKDQLATITYPSTLVVDYLPDALGRPTKASPGATTVSHHPSGQVSSITFANGAKTDLTFNNRYWPATLIHRDSVPASINSSTYVYDGVGNITSITDTVDTTYNRTLAYDNIDRLTTATSTPAWGVGSFTYNGRGDILTQTLGSFALTYTYHATSGVLTAVSGSVNYPTFTYDVYGNVTDNGVFSFVYDDTPSMTCSNCAGAARADYSYDGKNMRVKSIKNGVTTYSFYADNGNLLFEQDASTNAYSDHIYVKDKLVSKQSGTGNLFYHNDLVGSPMAATDAAGALAWRENYRPYGTQQLGTGNASNSLWFTGKSHDQDTKLSYMGARYYDTRLGRFMGLDPALFDETNQHSVNRYAYGNNNPHKFTDPDGQAALLVLFAPPIAMTAGAVISGGLNAAVQYLTTGTLKWGGIGGVLDAAGDGTTLGLLAAGRPGSATQTATQARSTATASTNELLSTHGMTQSKAEFRALKESIAKEGIKEPVRYVELHGRKYIVDGHHRVRAARELGIENVPAERVQLPYGGYKNVNDLFSAGN